MYSAPAKYHVNGAVINVVLKTPKPLDGLQGQVRAGYNQAHYGSYGGGLAATYAINDWTFDINYGLSHTKSWSREETWSNHLYDDKRTMIEDDMRRISQNWSNTIFASSSWKTLKLTYNGQIISDSKSWGHSSGTLGDYTNSYNMLSPVCYNNIALRYIAPFGMTVGGDYTRYSENRSQSLFKDSDYLLGSENRQDINRWHAYVDQQHQFGKWQLTRIPRPARNTLTSFTRFVPHSSDGFSCVRPLPFPVAASFAGIADSVPLEKARGIPNR